VCSKCEYDGIRGAQVAREEQEIHDLAFGWAHENWFTYEIDWDAQLGVHSVTINLADGSDPLTMSVCEFDAFVTGMRAVAIRVHKGM